ncbi:MAG TPA: hypothetical protein VL463_12930 [Kofleriaceae bacterium]|nr:hypothetical protein [Kofleriaceae bacterium]
MSPVRQAAGALRCRRRFLRFFPEGFRDAEYVELERDYKERAHHAWLEQLGARELKALLRRGAYDEIAARAIRIESRTNLLFSFEKMALRDAVKTGDGARTFATGLDQLIHGRGELGARFSRWIEAVASLPRRQTRVLTWPAVTVFPFLADPETHFFFKPMVTRAAARAYGVELAYASRPSWIVYEDLLRFTARVRRDLRDLAPRDQIDIQSFLWVLGSDEYAD